MKILLSPDGEPGGANPPAADLVKKSDVNEADAAELVRLRQAIADKEKTLKERETRMAELEDENRRLKTPPPPPERKKAEAQKRDWINGIFG